MKDIRHLFLFLYLTVSFTQTLLAQEMPKDFEFAFKYGFKKKVDQRTFFDSKKDSLIVYGVDTIMIFQLKLSKDEKQSIYEEMQKINFISYPDKYSYQHHDSEETLIGTPCQTYFLSVTLDHSSKSVEWNDCVHSKTKDENHLALMQLNRFIQNIIWAKDPLKDYHPTQILIDPN